jgi:hypothetical protein
MDTVQQKQFTDNKAASSVSSGHDQPHMRLLRAHREKAAYKATACSGFAFNDILIMDDTQCAKTHSK